MTLQARLLMGGLIVGMGLLVMTAAWSVSRMPFAVSEPLPREQFSFFRSPMDVPAWYRRVLAGQPAQRTPFDPPEVMQIDRYSAVRGYW